MGQYNRPSTPFDEVCHKVPWQHERTNSIVDPFLPLHDSPSRPNLLARVDWSGWPKIVHPYLVGTCRDLNSVHEKHDGILVPMVWVTNAPRLQYHPNFLHNWSDNAVPIVSTWFVRRIYRCS